jgi:hypothetical protein
VAADVGERARINTVARESTRANSVQLHGNTQGRVHTPRIRLLPSTYFLPPASHLHSAFYHVKVMEEAEQTLARLDLYVDADARALICRCVACLCALPTTGLTHRHTPTQQTLASS